MTKKPEREGVFENPEGGALETSWAIFEAVRCGHLARSAAWIANCTRAEKIDTGPRPLLQAGFRTNR